MSITIAWIKWMYLTFVVTWGFDNLSTNKPTEQYIETDTCTKCVAGNAVDGNNETCMRTKDIGINSNIHTTWWYVDLGNNYSLYSIRIEFQKETQFVSEHTRKGRFAGFSLYVSNTTNKDDGFVCYQNESRIPPLDFNTSCITHGRYVIFYNERVVGKKYPSEYQTSNVITELCEVTVQGCLKPGVYGEFCNETCPDNCQENRCDIISGTCLGCNPGWNGTYCNTTCLDGHYGLNCALKCVGRCNKDHDPCNHTTGLCDKGCADGWTGGNCTDECHPGTYGRNCLQKCSGNCLNNRTCNRANGTCDMGCGSGYTGDLCDKVCDNGTFGTNCDSKCGHCSENVTCNSLNGRCYNGCALGHSGDFCNISTESCHNVNGSCFCKNGIKVAFGCNKTFISPEKHETNTLTAVIGAGAAVFLLVFVGIMIYVIRQRRKKRNTSNEGTERIGFSTMDESLIKCDKKLIQKTGTHNVTYDSSFKERGEPFTHKKTSNLDELLKSLAEIKNTQMDKEYKKIPKGELHPCVAGKSENNLSKNRYTTIFPYDHSRVVLNTSTNESDYINANYIEDVFGKKKYLATQGPKNSTTVDFWRMVWQENARIIVCLTNLSESKTKKCAKYWPDLNDKHMEGVISIRCLKEQTYAENIIRHLRINKRTENTERDVFMFHYTQWPDHGVPEPLSLVVFHRHVMKTAEEHHMECIVVHCSAGIGRTGTFIALDALYNEGERTGKVNVPQYVEKMRNDRMNMIQGEDQYKTVYMALLEAFRGRLRAVPVDFFLKEFQDHSCYLNHGDVSKKSPFALEFEELLSFRKVYTRGDFNSGMSNVSANYVPNVLPVERYLCPLTNSTESLYYNAVCLQSFTQCDRFISAQFPLPDYTEHFLTLVKTYYTCTIVSLFPLEEVKSTSFWLPTKNQQKTVGPFTVKLAESTQAKYVAKTNITLQQKGGSSMRVAVLECRGWEDEYDSKSRRILIDLVQEAKIEERTHPTGRILVLSSDGAKRCGPFCAVFNALEQMMMDEEVDLFTITRQLQTRRPEFLSILDEYQFCFDTISDYLQNDTLYANI